jgi:lysophospholipase L1-like esterase
MGAAMRKLAGNVLVLIISTIVGYAIAESGVRALSPQNLSGSWRREAPSGGYQLNKDHGTARHELRPRVVYYEFSEFHRRGRARTPRSDQRILVLGDSFTFGWLLSEKDTYVARLQSAADLRFGPNHLEFVNAAAGGWGTAHYLAYYEDFGEAVGAQTVLVFLNTDDMGRSLRSGLYKFADNSTELTRSRPGQASQLKLFLNDFFLYETLLEHSHLVQLARSVLLAQRRRVEDAEQLKFDGVPIPTSKGTPASAEQARRLGMALFGRLIQLSRKRNHKLIVLTTGWHRFAETDASEPTAAFIAVAPQFFRESNIEFHDISDAVFELAAGSTAGITIANDGHPNEEGARIIAEAAWKVLAPLLD